MRWIETDTASNVDISSATAIGAYTADADRLVMVDVQLDAVAGNGDYVMYVTKQINGAGSAYIILPKTTMTAASGETAIGGQSGIIAVKSGDVLTVYVDGLAGDTTTPDYYTRWFEIDALVTLADDAITSAKFDESTAYPVKSADTGATAIARVGADSDTLETLSDEIAAVKAETAAIVLDTGTDGVVVASLANDSITAAVIAQDAIDADSIKADAVTEIGTGVWASATRTLTQSAASVAAVLAGSNITIQRGDTESISLTDIGALTGYTKLWFTVKGRKTYADSLSTIQIEKTGGLLYLNGAATTTSNGSITVDDEATGDITVVIKAAATAVLEPGTYFYDVQMLTASGVTTLTDGSFTVEGDVTRAVA